VPALAAVLAGARVVVCNNSGGAHLASALRTPVVVLFAGSEQVRQYAPRFGPSAVLTVPTPCSPCRQFACPYSLDCLDVPPERVAARALGLATPVPADRRINGMAGPAMGIPRREHVHQRGEVS
jgi:ADP-heptose:LPS heptosyltransferase